MHMYSYSLVVSSLSWMFQRLWENIDAIINLLEPKPISAELLSLAHFLDKHAGLLQHLKLYTQSYVYYNSNASFLDMVINPIPVPRVKLAYHYWTDSRPHFHAYRPQLLCSKVFLWKLGSNISVTSSWLHISCTLKSSQTRSKNFLRKTKRI